MAAVFLLFSDESSAVSLFDSYRIEIRLNDHGDNFRIGEQATFSIGIKKRVQRFGWFRGFYYTYVNTDLPDSNLYSTFPNNQTRVNLTRIGVGRYEYQTPVLQSFGAKTLRVRIIIPVFNQYYILLRANSYVINVTGPPNVEIKVPEDGSIFNTNSITVSGTINDNNARVEVNGIQAVVNGGVFRAEAVRLAEGQNEIIARASNEFGEAEDSIHVTLDTTAPRITIVQPANNSYTNQPTINITGAYEEANLSSIIINGVRANAGNGTFRLDNVRLNEGNNVIRAVATDIAGNTTTFTVNVTLDTILPQNPSISIHVEGGITDDRNINLILNAQGADEMILSENGNFIGANWEPYIAGRIFRLSQNPGQKNVFAKYRDRTGNESNRVSDGIILVPAVKPVSQGQVRIQDRNLLVQNLPYRIKGVTYQPTPIGISPENADINQIYTVENCDRDFRILQEMGCNTIRTYAPVTRVLLDKAQEYDIKVCAGYWISYDIDLGRQETREDLITDFRNYVREFKDHSAVLFWVIGNEQNYQNGDSAEWYSLADKMAMAAYDEEGINYHPVAIVNGDIGNVGERNFEADDVSFNYVDIWGINVYAGYSFLHNPHHGDFFERYADLSGKPLWISEYGIDAYDNTDNRESQKRQSAWDCYNWKEISGSDVCIGATLMSYSDEWWKAGDSRNHNMGGYATDIMPYNDCHPDRFSNEEWWGIMQWDNNQLIPRLAYYELGKRWGMQRNPFIVYDFQNPPDDAFYNIYSFIFASPASPPNTCRYSVENIDGRRCLAIVYIDNAADRNSWAGYGNSRVRNSDCCVNDTLTFFIKGQNGGEMCKVGIRDSHNNEAKINIPEYLPQGVTNVWQRVRIPLCSFGSNLNISSLANISFTFEDSIDSENENIYIDDIIFGIENPDELPPLVVSGFNSVSRHEQNSLGFVPQRVVDGNSQIDYRYDESDIEDNGACLYVFYTVRAGRAARIILGLNRIDASPFEYLSLWIKGAEGGESFNVYLADEWNSRGYVEINNVSAEWQRRDVPLYNFVLQGVDITSLANLEIVFEWGGDRSGEIYLDNIQFGNEQ